MTGGEVKREWFSEPCEASFEAFGLPCQVVRHNHNGHLCGYVGVPDSHPWHGKGYNWKQPMPPGWIETHKVSIDEIGALNVMCAGFSEDIDSAAPLTLLVRCHQGLTFAEGPYWPGEARASWWFGFDCAHSGDLVPGMSDHNMWASRHGYVYRNMDYVRSQCAFMAEDLAKWGGK